jgi:hypothetical protein
MAKTNVNTTSLIEPIPPKAQIPWHLSYPYFASESLPQPPLFFFHYHSITQFSQNKILVILGVDFISHIFFKHSDNI